MPDDQATAAPESPTPGPHTRMGGFTRSRRDHMIAGVAGGVAERLDVDPLIIRAAFVILAVAGGGGLVLYLLGWLLLPEEGEQDSIAGQVLSGRQGDSRRSRHTVIALLVAVAFLGVLHPWRWSLGRPVVAVFAVLALIAFSRHRTSMPAAPPSGLTFHGPGPGSTPRPGPGPQPGAGAGAPSPGFTAGEWPANDPTLTDLSPGDAEGHDQMWIDPTASWLSGPTAAAGYPTGSWSPPSTPRPPSLVAPLLAGLAALVAVSAVIGATGWVAVPLPAVLTVALLMSLATLVAAAQRGRFLGATLISLALAGMLVLSTAVPHPLAGGVGERTWHPAGVSDLRPSYRLGTGQATLDLSDIPPGALVGPVRASVGTGDLTVIVPAATALQVRQRAAAGSIDVLGDRQGGVSIDRTSLEPGRQGGDQTSPLHLDLQVGIGTIEVRRAG